MKTLKCHNCGRTGHWARECRQAKRPTAYSEDELYDSDEVQACSAWCVTGAPSTRDEEETLDQFMIASQARAGERRQDVKMRDAQEHFVDIALPIDSGAVVPCSSRWSGEHPDQPLRKTRRLRLTGAGGKFFPITGTEMSR